MINFIKECDEYIDHLYYELKSTCSTYGDLRDSIDRLAKGLIWSGHTNHSLLLKEELTIRLEKEKDDLFVQKLP